MIDTLVICGAGTMGSGIAQAAAQSGIGTVLYDVDPAMVDRAENQIGSSLDALQAKGRLDAPGRNDVLGRIRFTSDFSHCVGDVVVEAVVEDLTVKQALLLQLARLNTPDTILASNTSSLSIAAISKGLPFPERVCGMHFFNPATLMKLVEVVEAPGTEPAVSGAIMELARQMGKTPVLCRDAPGFIVNRVARHYYLESLRLLERDASNVSDMDRLLEAAGFRMGPFRLMDLIGNDVNLAVSRSLHEASGRAARFRPSPIQESKVAKGELGRKTGSGYHRYQSPE
jgi:3-hydroxybutyryl-CoA dehydrogenase